MDLYSSIKTKVQIWIRVTHRSSAYSFRLICFILHKCFNSIQSICKVHMIMFHASTCRQSNAKYRICFRSIKTPYMRVNIQDPKRQNTSESDYNRTLNGGRWQQLRCSTWNGSPDGLIRVRNLSHHVIDLNRPKLRTLFHLTASFAGPLDSHTHWWSFCYAWFRCDKALQS